MTERKTRWNAVPIAVSLCILASCIYRLNITAENTPVSVKTELSVQEETAEEIMKEDSGIAESPVSETCEKAADETETPVPVLQGETVQETEAGVENKEDTGFVKKDGFVYYFDPETGEMLKGEQFIDGFWYYFDETDGHMITGFVYLPQHRTTVYYDPDTGRMLKGRQLIDGQYYYLNEDTGEVCKGFIREYGKICYVDEDTAEKKSGQQFIDGSWYCFDEKTYEMLTGFQYLSSEKKTVYYEPDDGKMVYGERQIGGWRYYFDEKEGSMKTGFVYIASENKTAYFDEQGHMLLGEQTIGFSHYYFDENTGAMYTGFRKIASKNITVYYASDGVMQYGWQQIGGYNYYFNESDGAMYTGKQSIDGQSYFFEDNGRMVDFSDTGSYLILANKKHKLPSGYAPSDLYIPDVQMNYTMYLRKDAAYAIEKMFAAASRSGITLILGSAYRSESLQRTLYNGYVAQYGAAVADTISSRPGYSDHQTGLAADISDHDGATYLTQSMENTPEGIWLRDHAHEYGFIMRYPKGKDAITGYSYEPWHFRYVGVEYATKIYNMGVWYTFEEYFGVEGGDYN